MQLMRIGHTGQERPAVRLSDGESYDLSSLTDDVRVGAPVARPGAVICVGQNYAAHAAEMGGDPPNSPIIFLKHPNTVVGPYDDVLMPPGASRVDWEVELAVVIGQTARYLDSPDMAAEHIAGYAVANDVSERTYQFDVSGGQWSKGKCSETFNPLGPWLVPADDVPDVQRLNLSSSVNGEVRQSSATSDMLFSVAHIVWHLSHFLVLEPGDIINTGTPEGVALSGRFPYLEEGDTFECSVDGLGTQRQLLRRASTHAGQPAKRSP